MPRRQGKWDARLVQWASWRGRYAGGVAYGGKADARADGDDFEARVAYRKAEADRGKQDRGRGSGEEIWGSQRGLVDVKWHQPQYAEGGSLLFAQL